VAETDAQLQKEIDKMTAKMDAQTVVVEPNLSKRMEQRKENAIRRAKEKEMWEQMQVQL
jgi:hypothetical protein